ncbi:MAG TPA: hypothetical protein VFU09_14085 [Candidatus Udaeobacter sp.]|nr:hypothetical protein [Candidatus Udaeobacter sp.]
MTTEKFDYITAVFTEFMQPIADLCDGMLRLPCGEPNEVQAAGPENGYARSIIALTAFLFEGACGRARYFSDLDQAKRWSAAEILRAFGENALADKIEEIFVVRDAIAHAHLWTGKVAWTPNNLKFAEHPVQLLGYGDGKFRRIVDLNSRTTRKLKLDVFPARIHRGTAIIVLKECAKALQDLEMKHKKEFLPLAHRTVRFRGEFQRFYKWVRELPGKCT